ncbi:MAG: hypothetical protein K940chlam6_00506 [Chlamydiae bacterium]|nr:hypothetical protein [Chlamydiota bacterium]
MSNKELSRLEIMQNLKNHSINQSQATDMLRISTRQVKRLWKAFKIEGSLGKEFLVTQLFCRQMIPLMPLPSCFLSIWETRKRHSRKIYPNQRSYSQTAELGRSLFRFPSSLLHCYRKLPHCCDIHDVYISTENSP